MLTFLKVIVKINMISITLTINKYDNAAGKSIAKRVILKCTILLIDNDEAILKLIAFIFIGSACELAINNTVPCFSAV